MAEKKAVVSDQGVLATVETNTGEVARFSDGTSVLRQQPETNKDNPNPYFKGIHLGNLQAEVFKDVFQVGLTVFQVMIRLSDPEAGNASDGQLKFSLPANAKQDRTNFKFTATAKDFEKLPGLSGAIGELAGAAENIVLTFPENEARRSIENAERKYSSGRRRRVDRTQRRQFVAQAQQATTLRNGCRDLCGVRALFILRIHCGHHEVVSQPSLNAAVGKASRRDRRRDLGVGSTRYSAGVDVVAGHRRRARIPT